MVTPTEVPTETPTVAPTETPTEIPTDTPTEVPTNTPTAAPSEAPTEVPTDTPTEIPTEVPTDTPTEPPTDPPTDSPSETPTIVPSDTPTVTATAAVTPAPTPGFVQKYLSIAGQKLWEDQDNASGVRPDEVTVRLIRNGTVVAEVTVTVDDGWQYRFDDLPCYDPQGRPYAYTVSERPVPGYYARVDGYDLINRLVPNEPTPSDPPVKGPPSEEELVWKLYLPNHEPEQYGKLLKTGLELPAYPFVFAGIGCAALVTLCVTKRKRRKK